MIKLAKENTVESKGMCQAYNEVLIQLADEGVQIMDLEADLQGAMGTKVFENKYPERVVQCGIAEQSMVSIAAGLAVVGFVPFAHSFAPFLSRRSCDQVVMQGAYAKTNIKLFGADPGVSAALGGGTHQGLEDVAIMRAIPGITVFEPCDTVQLKWAVEKAAKTEGVFYLRVPRMTPKKIYEEGSDFEIGKATVLREGSDATIFTAGMIMIPEALDAANELAKEGINVRVVDLFSIKPIDRELIVKCAKETGAVLVAENHQSIGGLNSAVCEVLTQEGIAVKYRNLGAIERFGIVGEVDYLLDLLKISARHMVEAIRAMVSAK